LIQIRPDIWIPDDGLGFRHAPNVDVQINTGERTVRLRTDVRGNRISPLGQSLPKYRVLALGDSFLAALQVEYQQTMTSLLEDNLSARLGAPVAVVNGGVGAWGPNHYRIKMLRELEHGGYDLVVVFLYVGNDVECEKVDRFPPRKSSVHPFRWPRNLSGREWVDAVAQPINDWFKSRSHLYILFKNRAWLLLMRAGLSKRQLQDVYLRSYASSKCWTMTAEICADMVREAALRGVAAVFVFLPGAHQVDEQMGLRYARALGIAEGDVDLGQPSRILAGLFSERGLPVIDMTPAFREAFASGRPELYGKVDTHFGPGGHRVVAESLSPIILSRIRDGEGRDVGSAASR
jgi:lysophospholipase L1-like esterase